MKKIFFLFAIIFLFIITFFWVVKIMDGKKYNENLDVNALGILAEKNREYSFTDKKYGYYYSTTHFGFNESWFAGWNLNTKRIINDYTLYIDNILQRRENALITVYPHKVIRKYNECEEIFSMLDNMPILIIEVNNVKGKNISFQITGGLDTLYSDVGCGAFFIPKESPEGKVLMAPINEVKYELNGNLISTDKNSNGFVLLYGEDVEDLKSLLLEFRKNYKAWQSDRELRLNNILNLHSPFKTNDLNFDKAVKWILLTTDQLIMNQMGLGIYAGLPWFNDYWGRDIFITFPGACLVTGQFEIAKNILLAYSKYQNDTVSSKYYGRIPNRARPNEIIYNTTDGTPRFIIEIYDYIKYSGDTAIIKELYPNIKKAFEGMEKNWVDEKGYLTHEDADTWMDAKEKGVRPFSPRGNRANDIQALWYAQLKAGAYFAKVMKDEQNETRWEELAQKVKKSFLTDFFDEEYNYIADRITQDNEKDFKLRPNQLFAFELIDDTNKKMEIIKTVWSELVYPWGVASLSQMDPDFHPYHENWHYYHKDAAYHNGTVWLWNNGIAMQRMIEFGQKELAYKLFQNMNHQALVEGAVGSLSENADALLREGEKRAKLSGTFLQAWSNSEHIRVWYQYFLGIQPEMQNNEIKIIPNIPKAIKNIYYSLILGNGKLFCSYKAGAKKEYEYSLNNIKVKIIFSLPNYDEISLELEEGNKLQIIESKSTLQIKIFDANGNEINKYSVAQNPIKIKESKTQKNYFKDVDFCKPFLQENLKSLSTYHEQALEY
jgi:predicted glycogen debranching enzyme